MENILKQNLVRMEKFICAFVIAVSIVFGILNPSVYIMGYSTAKEISGMGMKAHFETAESVSGNVYLKHLNAKAELSIVKHNFAEKLILNNNYANMWKVSRTTVTTLPERVVKIDETTNDVMNVDATEKVSDPKDISSDVIAVNPGILDMVPGEDEITKIIPEEVVKEEEKSEPAYVEIHGMKIDPDGYVTEITGGISDGLLVFPTDVRCKGIRSDVFERSDAAIQEEVDEIWIPKNITQIEAGVFDCLKNVNFIEVADGNPVYYSDMGILYYMDGTVACMPQRRIR